MPAALTAFLCGLLFALGLGLGGMTRPSNVQAFLDIAGAWDFRLALVMGGAIAVHAPLRWWILRRRGQPVLGASFPSFPPGKVDRRLVAGAAIFGVGWGLSGLCPGPALTALTTGAGTIVLFVVAMAGGIALARKVEGYRPLAQRQPPAQGMSTPTATKA